MSRGQPRAEAQPHDGDPVEPIVLPQPEDPWDRLPQWREDAAPADETADAAEYAVAEYREPAAAPRGAPAIIASLVALLALLWLSAVGWAFATAPMPGTPIEILNAVALVSTPLILLGIAWLIFGRSPRRETERFTRAVERMRSESEALEVVLESVGTRMEENQQRLANEAGRLMALGEEASDRLGRVTHYLSREGKNLDQRAEALEAAASNAKVDIGVLLQDLPRAEEQARGMAAAMRDAGLAAHEQAGALEGHLTALAARGREADEVVGGAAQRLGAHLARVESTTSMVTEKLDEATVGMTAAIDGAMARAAEAIGQTRASLDAQGSAMLATVEQSRAALAEAGDEAARSLAQRIERIGVKIEGLAGQIATQDEAGKALIGRLGSGLAELDTKFVALRDESEGNAGRLGESFAQMRGLSETLVAELSSGQERSDALLRQLEELTQSLATATGEIEERLPAALARVEEQAGRTHAATQQIAPAVSAIEASAIAASERLTETESSVVRQRESIDALLSRLTEGAADAEQQLRGLGSAASEAQEAAAKMAREAGPELIEALLRVRETAAQASDRAREAIAAAIPDSAAALAEASREAMTDAVSREVERQMADVVRVAEAAVETARKSSERLTRQLLTIGETAAAIEQRIDDSRRDQEEREGETLSHQVALLTESLNSTAIDVTKILSNEVTDSAWAAYLKGDRGIFTRRAVKLLSGGESREILRHYEGDMDFRDHVNRYIHDFEAMMRRVLADRDGSPLGVTILSSDMGKLYVALAQAIERLRK